MVEGTVLPTNLQFLTVLVYNTGGSPLFILLAPAAITGTATAVGALTLTANSVLDFGTTTSSTSSTLTTATPWGSPSPAVGDTYSIATNATTAQGIIVPPGPNPVVLPMVISAIVPGAPNTPTNIRAISVRGDTASGANAVGEMLATFAGSYGP